jgi:hypothetical protein
VEGDTTTITNENEVTTIFGNGGTSFGFRSPDVLVPDSVDCGEGEGDFVRYDSSDTLRNCENRERISPQNRRAGG